jgi:hypothetical protein
LKQAGVRCRTTHAEPVDADLVSAVQVPYQAVQRMMRDARADGLEESQRVGAQGGCGVVPPALVPDLDSSPGDLLGCDSWNLEHGLNLEVRWGGRASGFCEFISAIV